MARMEARDPGLIGRRHELELMAEALADDSCCGVAFRGPAGVGKTRLAEECLRLAGDLGFVTRRVLATPSSIEVPLGAMSSLIPPLGADVNPLGAARAALRDTGDGSGRLLLLVDDAQWLDDTSAALILQVVLDGDAFAVVTIRSGEPLPAALSTMLRGEVVRQIEVGPLSDREIDELVTAQLRRDGDRDAEVDASVIARVVELSAGSPLAAHEIVLGAVDSGAIAPRDGRWTVVDAIERSTRVVDLVGERLARLGDAHLRALALVALADPLPAAWVSGADLDDLGALEAAGLVTVGDAGAGAEIRIAHPLYGEVLRSTMSPLARRVHLGTLLDRAEGRAIDDRDRLRMVAWARQVGRTVASDDLWNAAQRAFALHRFDLAADLLGAIPPGDRTAEFRLKYANALSWIGDHERVEEIVREMLADPVDDAELAGAAHFQAFRRQASGDFDGANRLMRDALDRIDDPDAARMLTVSIEGNSIGLLGPADAIERIAPLIDHLEGGVYVTAAHILSLALLLDGRPVEATGHAGRALAVHRSLWFEEPLAVFPSHPSTSLQIEALALCGAGRVDDAVDLVTTGLELDDDPTSAIVGGMLAMGDGYVRWLGGDLAGAADRFEAGIESWTGGPHQCGPRWLYITAMGSVAAAQLGDEPRAAEFLRHAESSAPSIVIDPMLRLARAWTAVAGHRLGDAIDVLCTGIDDALSDGAKFFAIEMAFSLLRLGAADRVPAAIGDLRGTVDGALLPVRLDAVAAAAQGDPAGLFDAGDALEELGVLIEAAETFAAAARLWDACGDGRRATSAARRARDLVDRHPEVRTPGLVLPVAHTPLTAREREVAALAADGTAAKAIAERLFISERTVTNHLQRVYEKLGVSSRAGLRDALGRS